MKLSFIFIQVFNLGIVLPLYVVPYLHIDTHFYLRNTLTDILSLLSTLSQWTMFTQALKTQSRNNNAENVTTDNPPYIRVNRLRQAKSHQWHIESQLIHPQSSISITTSDFAQPTVSVILSASFSGLISLSFSVLFFLYLLVTLFPGVPALSLPLLTSIFPSIIRSLPPLSLKVRILKRFPEICCYLISSQKIQ